MRCFYIQNIKTKGLIKLVGISKDEARILNETYNVKFGACGISHTYTRHKKYFLCESDRNLAALNEIRGVKDYKPSKKTKLR